ncbi:MAG: DegV family protein [Erysipelotrichaceae bacterium]|nr:DegV family protein [Erysipelotrichaceae bacterium]
MNYKIIGDSCVDYTDYRDGLNWVTRVPLTITLEGVEYVDDSKLDCDDLLAKMAKSNEGPKSACPSPGQFLAAYEEGDADEIYVVTLSSPLSGTYASATMAKTMLQDKDSNKKVHVFDSRSAAAGEVAICVKIKDLLDAGYSFEEVVQQVEDFISSMNSIFTLETLETLRKNGRLTKLQSVITEKLNLKMVMGATPEGEIEALGKALTISAAIKKMIEIIKERGQKSGFEDRVLYITQCQALERAEMIKTKVLEVCQFKDVVICEARGISSIYANSGGIILAF